MTTQDSATRYYLQTVGWLPGFNKIQLVKLLQALPCTLAEAKYAVDEILEGRKVYLRTSDIEFVERLLQAGVVVTCSITKDTAGPVLVREDDKPFTPVRGLLSEGWRRLALVVTPLAAWLFAYVLVRIFGHWSLAVSGVIASVGCVLLFMLSMFCFLAFRDLSRAAKELYAWIKEGFEESR